MSTTQSPRSSTTSKMLRSTCLGSFVLQTSGSASTRFLMASRRTSLLSRARLRTAATPPRSCTNATKPGAVSSRVRLTLAKSSLKTRLCKAASRLWLLRMLSSRRSPQPRRSLRPRSTQALTSGSSSAPRQTNHQSYRGSSLFARTRTPI